MKRTHAIIAFIAAFYLSIFAVLLTLRSRLVTRAHAYSSNHTFPSHLSFLLDNPLRKLIEPPQKVLALLGLFKSDVVVDFGCGTGYYTIPIVKQVQKTIGIDVQPETLQKTEK